MPGALVTLERITSADATDTVSTVLSDVRGEYAVLAPAAGRFRLLVKRIGVRPFVSDIFAIAAGEAHRLDVELDLGNATLAIVDVRGATPCATRFDEAVRIASLWEDARAALTATAISRRDSLVRTRFVRFVREIDPTSLMVASEALQVFDSSDVGADPYFRSLSGDSLSRMGYWRSVAADTTLFYGPDAAALLSGAFVRDHCFGIVGGKDARPGMVGLAFEPTSNRAMPLNPPDVRGTIWLDAQTSELRQLEFTWTKIAGRVDAMHVGGVVSFTRLGGGPWVISRWALRMPRAGDVRPPSLSDRLTAPVSNVLMEEGGMMLVDSLQMSAHPGTITGVVRDSAGRPFAGARVRVVGTRYAAVTDANGAYALDGIPPGLYTLVADHDGYRALGVRIGQADLVLDEGASRRASFRAPDARTVVAHLCGDGARPRRSATLRVTVLNQVNNEPLVAARIALLVDSASRPARGEASVSAASLVVRAQAETDAGGAALFCGVPSNVSILIAIPDGEGRLVPATTVQLKPDELGARVVRIAVPARGKAER